MLSAPQFLCPLIFFLRCVEDKIQQTNMIDPAIINEIVEHINRVEAKIDAMLNVAAVPVKNPIPGPSASQSKEVKF